MILLQPPSVCFSPPSFFFCGWNAGSSWVKIWWKCFCFVALIMFFDSFLHDGVKFDSFLWQAACFYTTLMMTYVANHYVFVYVAQSTSGFFLSSGHFILLVLPSVYATPLIFLWFLWMTFFSPFVSCVVFMLILFPLNKKNAAFKVKTQG